MINTVYLNVICTLSKIALPETLKKTSNALSNYILTNHVITEDVEIVSPFQRSDQYHSKECRYLYKYIYIMITFIRSFQNVQVNICLLITIIACLQNTEKTKFIFSYNTFV